MIRLHQFEISPYCDKIRRVLHVKKAPYEIVEVPLTRARSIARKNPARKLPFLEHDGQIVADSTDIAHYLERIIPDPALVPADPRLAALCHVLEDWADESLYFYEMRLRFGEPANAARWIPELLKHDPPLARGLIGRFVPRQLKSVLSAQGVGRKSKAQVLVDLERHVAALDGLLLDGDWLVGPALTLADISVYAELACIDGTPEGTSRIDAAPRVRAWLARVDDATRG